MRNTHRPYNFYFTHNPMIFANLIRILNDGYIRLGKDIPPKYRFLGGRQPLPEIYGNILFDNIRGRQKYWGVELIINPNIVERYDFGFRFGWQGYELQIKKSDSNTIFWNKINLIEHHLQTVRLSGVSSDGQIISEDNVFSIHEIVFMEKIPINKYILAIVCDHMTEQEFEYVKKIITDKKYNIKLIRRRNKKSINPLPLKKLLTLQTS